MAGAQAEQLRGELASLIRKLSYREGKFTLASGKESSFYVDIKNVSLHPEGARLIGRLTWQLLSPELFGGVGGPTLGADPIATAISLGALDVGKVLPAFIIRKEPKKHGTSQWIEGRENLPAGTDLLMIEDVVTTGGSALKAIEKVRAEGFRVSTIVSVLDRQEGGEEAMRSAGIKLVALTRIDEIRKAR
ncbi:MAG: orotate phosphoribosyltransferase [Deltaproteobacteria bacterium]|nr:orotate phosphoribosyltransferase [Deltaproteobacteria bacterium]